MQKEKTNEKITKQDIFSSIYNIFIIGLLLVLSLVFLNTKTFASNELQDFKSILMPYTDIPYSFVGINLAGTERRMTYTFNNPDLKTLPITNNQLFVYFQWVGVGEEPNFFGGFATNLDTYNKYTENDKYYFQYYEKVLSSSTLEYSSPIKYVSNVGVSSADGIAYNAQFGQLSSHIFALPLMQETYPAGSWTPYNKPLEFGLRFSLSDVNGWNQTEYNDFNNNYVLKLAVAPDLRTVLETYKSSFDLETVQDQYYNLGYDAGYLAGYDAGYNSASSATIETAYQEGYNIGYQLGLNEADQQVGTIYQTAYNRGYQDSLQANQPIIYNQGYLAGQNAGYTSGLADAQQNPIISMISQGFGAVGTILDIELLPSITLGALVLIPVLFGLIAFIIGKKKGD